jgi:hypothetical protein
VSRADDQADVLVAVLLDQLVEAGCVLVRRGVDADRIGHRQIRVGLLEAAFELTVDDVAVYEVTVEAVARPGGRVDYLHTGRWRADGLRQLDLYLDADQLELRRARLAS